MYEQLTTGNHSDVDDDRKIIPCASSAADPPCYFYTQYQYMSAISRCELKLMLIRAECEWMNI